MADYLLSDFVKIVSLNKLCKIFHPTAEDFLRAAQAVKLHLDVPIRRRLPIRFESRLIVESVGKGNARGPRPRLDVCLVELPTIVKRIMRNLGPRTKKREKDRAKFWLHRCMLCHESFYLHEKQLRFRDTDDIYCVSCGRDGCIEEEEEEDEEDEEEDTDHQDEAEKIFQAKAEAEDDDEDEA